jgi:hypothetical protein
MMWITVPLLYVALVFLPAWAAVAVAIPVATLRYGYLALLPAGVALDAFFGAPTPVLGGFHYIYTALFVVMSVIAYLLRTRMAE